MNALDALGNPVRRQLMELLHQRPRAVAELHGEVAGISRPAVSRHLRLLKEAGLVTSRPEGTRRLYAVDPAGFEPLRAYLERFWDDALPRFALVAENVDR